MDDIPEVRFANLPSPSIALTHCRLQPSERDSLSLSTQSPQTHHKIVDAQDAGDDIAALTELVMGDWDATHGDMAAPPPPPTTGQRISQFINERWQAVKIRCRSCTIASVMLLFLLYTGWNRWKRFVAYVHGLQEGPVLWAMLIAVCAFAWLVWRVAHRG